jgi:hypothetical protein
MPIKHGRFLSLALFLVTLMVLLITVAPSIHTSDSPELAAAAHTLGIPHAPGYALYILLAHIATYLPVGDIAIRLNLLSTLATALCAPLLFRLLLHLVHDWRVASGTTLILIWSNGIWSNGLVAEVYALQLLSFCVALSALLILFHTPMLQPKQVLFTGVLFGLAVALHPANVLFAPAFVFVCIWKYRISTNNRDVPIRTPVSIKHLFLAGLVSIAIFTLSLLYFPIRYAANPLINAAGYYDAQCQYQTVNLQSVSGITWLITGQQFKSLFFGEGLLPSLHQLSEGLRWFWLNFLGVGVVIGGIGLWTLARQHKKLLFVWLVLILPYIYFFLTYGANDRFAMFSPIYLSWTIPLAFGFQQLNEPKWLRWLPLAFALIMLLINYPLLNLRHNTEHHDRTLLMLENIPPDAAVFGHWHDVVAMRYFQITEGQRQDITLYNLFFFNDYPQAVNACLERHFAADEPVIFINAAYQPFVDEKIYDFQTIFISQRYSPPLYLQLITKESGG